MKNIPEPWKSFFEEIDQELEEEVRLEILGGFVVTVLYNSPRTTSDVDTISIVPYTQTSKLMEDAGEGSPLHKRYGVYLDWSGVASLTENYEDRLTEVFAGKFKRLRFFAFDPYDLLLAKIERNIDRDREDVLFLAKAARLDLKILEERYFKELRIYLGNPEREDLTLRLWVEMIEEDRNRK